MNDSIYIQVIEIRLEPRSLQFALNVCEVFNIFVDQIRRGARVAELATLER